MQRAADRQKTLAAHGALLSDQRLPVEALDFSRIAQAEGRVLGHGQDEQSGRNYLMLESTQAKVYFAPCTPEMEEARSRGELRVNSFVLIQKTSLNQPAHIKDLGNADHLLSKPQYFTHAAKRLLNQGMMPVEDGWGGWLGRYQAALVKTAIEISRREEEKLARRTERNRQRDRSLGR